MVDATTTPNAEYGASAKLLTGGLKRRGSGVLSAQRLVRDVSANDRERGSPALPDILGGHLADQSSTSRRTVWTES
jgi:hypothetical protein